eukprot:1256880-Prymnesium_polylepis.1
MELIRGALTCAGGADGLLDGCDVVRAQLALGDRVGEMLVDRVVQPLVARRHRDDSAPRALRPRALQLLQHRALDQADLRARVPPRPLALLVREPRRCLGAGFLRRLPRVDEVRRDASRRLPGVVRRIPAGPFHEVLLLASAAALIHDVLDFPQVVFEVSGRRVERGQVLRALPELVAAHRQPGVVAIGPLVLEVQEQLPLLLAAGIDLTLPYHGRLPPLISLRPVA